MRFLISFQPGSPTASTSPSPAPPASCHTAAPPLQTALLPIRPIQVHFQAEEFSKLTWPLFHTVASIMKLPSHTCHQWGKVSQTQRRQSFNPIRAFWSYSEHLVLSALGEICITFSLLGILWFLAINVLINVNKDEQPRGIFFNSGSSQCKLSNIDHS